MHIIDRKLAYDGHYKLSQLQVQDGETVLKRERFEPGKAVAALVFNTQTQQYILTRQYRVGPESELIEVAAGMIDGDEAPEEPSAVRFTKSWAMMSTTWKRLCACYPRRVRAQRLSRFFTLKSATSRVREEA
jgi:hypothetical protein